MTDEFDYNEHKVKCNECEYIDFKDDMRYIEVVNGENFWLCSECYEDSMRGDRDIDEGTLADEEYHRRKDEGLL